jgi:plasmid stabilization system protein ParE
MKYGFHPEARLEYREAAVFYEARQPGLGAAFTREIEAAIDRILETPELFRFVEQDVRRCFAHTFPHGVLYTVEGDFILIVAVAHGSRKPGYWHERLSPGQPNG